MRKIEEMLMTKKDMYNFVNPFCGNLFYNSRKLFIRAIPL